MLSVPQPIPHHNGAVSPGLRDVLDDRTYESLARRGEAMTTAAMATYAYGQIDQARTGLNAISKETTYASLKISPRNHRERRRPPWKCSTSLEDA